jgi:hypothetical protein
MQNETIEVPVHLLESILEILNSLDYERDEDSLSMSFFKGRLNEDCFFCDKNKLEEMLGK